MKIKLKPHNQGESVNSKSLYLKGKENYLAKSQSSLSTDPNRQFATDITKKQLNCKYKFTVPKT